MITEIIYALLLIFGSGTVLLFIFIYMLLTNPEKVKLWSAYIARFLTWFKNSWDKRAVANEIEARTENFSKNIIYESEDNYLAYPLKIKWVDKEEKKDTFIKNGRAVVKMYHHNNQAKNFMFTVLDYLSLSLLADAQPYIDEEVNEAIRFTMAEKFFITEGRIRALDIFKKEVILPHNDNETQIYDYYETLRKLDENGFFTRVFLKDLSELGELSPTGIHTSINEETKKYTENIKNLAFRKKGEEIDVDFKKKYIKSAIVFIATAVVYLEKGTKPYVNYIYKLYSKGFKNIHIFAAGNKITIAEDVVKEIEKQGKLIKITQNYFTSIGTDGKQFDRIYILLKRI